MVVARCLVALGALCCVIHPWSSAVSVAAERAAEIERFERKVRPLLVKRCGKCHSGAKPRAGLDLVRVERLLKGGRSGPVVIPGNPTGSLLIQAIRRKGPGRMPQGGQLQESEILDLVTWIKNGAATPPTDMPGRREAGTAVTDTDREWWSFLPLDNRPVPVDPADSWSRSSIDHLVHAGLVEAGLSASPDASRRTWLRRVSFDLVGLPPTPEEIQAFESDTSPAAFARVVDRLLASPRYGERWARHWLDIVRYADTNGGGFDYVYPTAWRYRDYVVRAFNRDTPYDRFLVEQLAGDLLPAESDDERDVDRRLATGFLAIAPKGLGMQDKELMAMDVVDDQVDVLGRTLMGLTLSCARCHDHKFDPVPTADYYALAGIFRSTVSLQDLDKNPSYWPERVVEAPSVAAARRKHAQDTKNVQARIDKIVTAENARLVADAKSRLDAYLLVAAAMHHRRDQRPAVAHWPMDSDAGVQVTARVGPPGLLTHVDRAQAKNRPRRIQDGKIGRALHFLPGRIVQIDNRRLKELSMGAAQDFSVGLWLRAPGGYIPRTADSIVAAEFSNGAMWFIALRPGGYNGVYLRHYTGSKSIDIKPGSNQLPLLTDGQWHHLVITSDRDKDGICYIDGREVGRVSIGAISSQANYVKPTRLVLGASTNGFAGDLDDVAIWNRVLPADEIAGLYQGGGATPPQDVTAIASSRPKRDDVPTVAELVATHRVVPSIARALAQRIQDAASQPKSPLRPLLETMPEGLESLRKLVPLDGPELQKQLADKDSPWKAIRDADALYPENVKPELVELRSTARRLAQTTFPKPRTAMIAFDNKAPADLRIHVAGDNRRLGDVVERGFPRVLVDQASRAAGQRAVPAKASGRLELARWLTRPGHPLVPRVIANRVWQWHFGEGLVRTADNFGQLGEEPTHPRLLDHLAALLISDGWSLKALHRRIVLSSVYRQSSRWREGPMEVDADNRLLWRMNRRRLEAEPYRDAMLAASGGLDSEMAGTLQTWKPKEFSVDDANKETARFQTSRRSLYLPVVRTTMHEMMELFDVGDPNSITSRRANTTVPPQALFLLNNPFVQERSQGLAERVSAWSDDETERIRRAWWLVLSRPPSPSELGRARQYLAATRRPDGTGEKLAWTALAWALFSLNEFLYVD